VSAIAEELLKTEYDAVRIIFNRFQSAISFKPTIATVLRCPSWPWSGDCRSESAVAFLCAR
jgi:F0F1-type ATP synthase gamma subunit